MASNNNIIKTGCNDIRIQQYPTLEEGNDAFPDSEYRVSSSPIKGEDHGMELHHELHNAGLIRNFVEKKMAAYACAISSPRSAFRQLQTSPNASQKIHWNPCQLAEPPYFTPMIVGVEKIEHTLETERDGVHPLWNGTRVTFPKGARLAQGPVLKLFDAEMHSLLTLVMDEKLKPGQFLVKVSNNADFRFKVHCHPDLHSFMQAPGDRHDKRRDIMIHMVTACFHLLKQDYSEDSEGGWSIKCLEVLSEELEKRHDYINWSDLEFHPERASTLLYPHRISSPDTTND